jgi:uncharacterized short protein YbdD (DUF466 family)
MSSRILWLADAVNRGATQAHRLRTVLRDILAGAAGTDAYRNYLVHHRVHHPEQNPLTRESFYHDELAARWDGMRRCC